MTVTSNRPHGDLLVTDVPAGPAGTFEPHSHRFHQLAWARSGILHVQAGGRFWSLPSTLAVWLPAGVEHAVTIRRSDSMTGVYLRPERVPTTGPTGWWAAPEVVAVSPLLRELVRYLEEPDLTDEARAGAEAVVVAVLEPVWLDGLDLPMPTDPRALDVALRILSDPASPRRLEEWADEVGAASRTLSRLFARETGMGFVQWRAQARLQASLVHLAAGRSVEASARAVGYDSAPGFITAFRKLTGQTPSACRIAGTSCSRP